MRGEGRYRSPVVESLFCLMVEIATAMANEEQEGNLMGNQPWRAWEVLIVACPS